MFCTASTEKEVVFKWLTSWHFLKRMASLDVSAGLFWLFSCAPHVTNHFLDVCEGVKTDTVGLCAGEALKNANRHIQIKVSMSRTKKGHTMLVSWETWRSGCLLRPHLNLHKVSMERKDTVFMAAVTRHNKHHICLVMHYQQNSSCPPARHSPWRWCFKQRHRFKEISSLTQPIRKVLTTFSFFLSYKC